MLKPYTNGISTLTVSDQLCVFRPGPEERKIKHCHTYHPCLGTSHASLTYYFLSHCATRILAVCTRVDVEIPVLREVDILPSRYASSGYEARGKEDL